MDFTLKTYQNLLIALKQANYNFVTFEEFCEGMAGDKFVILRHDVDLKAGNSLKTAKIEHRFGVKASYYFRIVPQSKKKDIIRQIAQLEHEIGYHYEDLTFANGDIEKAIQLFVKNLHYFRLFYPVRTICMHGSPTSKFDNKDIWKSYNYRDFDIIGEPYFDVDFNKVFYLTDTGRCWDGGKYSIRDKVQSVFTQKYHTTDQIIEAIKASNFPDKAMITTHPQRWSSNFAECLAEYLWQSAKNQVKYFLNKNKHNDEKTEKTDKEHIL